MFSSFSNSAFSMRYHKMVATVVAPYEPTAFDGLDILPRSDICWCILLPRSPRQQSVALTSHARATPVQGYLKLFNYSEDLCSMLKN